MVILLWSLILALSLSPAQAAFPEVDAYLNVPIAGVGAVLRITLPFVYAFDTSTTTIGRSSHPRSFSSSGSDASDAILPPSALDHYDEGDLRRLELILTVESYLEHHWGLDGHNCMLRALCEATMVPNHQHGFLGDILNLMLTPDYILFGETHNNFTTTPQAVFGSDLFDAQRQGLLHSDCSSYHKNCATSFFEFLTPSHPDYKHPKKNRYYQGANMYTQDQYQ